MFLYQRQVKINCLFYCLATPNTPSWNEKSRLQDKRGAGRCYSLTGIVQCTVPSSCYPAPAAGRFGARNSYYRLCAASTTSAAMRRASGTPRDTDQWGQTTWLRGGASFCTRHKSYTRQRIGSAAPVGSTLSGRRRSGTTRGGDRSRRVSPPARFSSAVNAERHANGYGPGHQKC